MCPCGSVIQIELYVQVSGTGVGGGVRSRVCACLLSGDVPAAGSVGVGVCAPACVALTGSVSLSRRLCQSRSLYLCLGVCVSVCVRARGPAPGQGVHL